MKKALEELFELIVRDKIVRNAGITLPLETGGMITYDRDTKEVVFAPAVGGFEGKNPPFQGVRDVFNISRKYGLKFVWDFYSQVFVGNFKYGLNE